MEKEKKEGKDTNLTSKKTTKQTASKKEIQEIFKKAVKTHGNTLERLSKN
ncbi:hypothetical protein [Psychrobacillus psychrodurans]